MILFLGLPPRSITELYIFIYCRITDRSPGKRNCAVLHPMGIKAENCDFPNAYNCKHKLEK